MKQHCRSKPLLILCVLLLWSVWAPRPFGVEAHPARAVKPLVTPLDAAPFGLNVHLSTRYTSLETMHIPADLIVEAGAGWAREDVHWWRVQPTPDTWDWSFTDQAMRVLLQRNINIVGVIGHPPGWATPYGGDAASDISFYAPDPARFASFAREVVRRYGQYVTHWEIWNEPDNPLFWKPAPDPIAYAELLEATATAIREVDPDANILIGGINPFDTHFLQYVAEYGAWSSFDIIAIHPYVDPASPEAGNIVAAADGVRTLARRYGEKPIWVTEVGWSSGAGNHDPIGIVDEQQQADFLARATLLLWKTGVERIFWYTLKDDPGNPYGLVALGSGRDDFSTLKPAFYAFRTLSEQLGGARFVGMRDLFTRTTLFGFEDRVAWRRGDQPYGQFDRTSVIRRAGRYSARLRYDFPSRGNDFVVFVREHPVAVPGTPYALGMWVYGDGTPNTVKIWLRDAEGEILQFALGTVGPPGWRLLQAPIGGAVAPWDRINLVGNGQLDFPVSLYAVVLDDAPDSFAGSGAIYLDQLVAISGPEAYDLQLERDGEAIDVLWAPGYVRARLPTRAARADVVYLNGTHTTVLANTGSIPLELTSSPIFVRHRR